MCKLFWNYGIIDNICIIHIQLIEMLLNWLVGHRDRMVVGFTTICAISQSVPITTNFVSLNPANGEVYLIQHYVIKVVSGLRQVWFSPGSPVSSTNKTDCHNITEILLKVALNTITLHLNWLFGREKFSKKLLVLKLTITTSVIVILQLRILLTYCKFSHFFFCRSNIQNIGKQVKM
jgi:hypothetical protein